MSPEINESEPDRADIRRVDRLASLASRIVIDKTVSDPIEPVLLDAVLPHIKGEVGSLNGGALRPVVAYDFAFKKGTPYTDGIAIRKLQSSLDKQLRRIAPDDYPARGDDPNFYKESGVLDEIDGDEMSIDMLLPLRYNDPNAYKILCALINRLSQARGIKPTVVDTGIAFGAGTKKLKMYDKYPFHKSQALLPPRNGKRIHKNLPKDNETQRFVEEALGIESVIGRIVGTDVFSVNESDLELGSSETYLMSRRLSEPEGVAEFHGLFYEARVDKDILLLEKEYIDATHPEDLAKVEPYLPGGKADIFIFSGVILQFPGEKLNDIFESFRELCNPGALFLVSEWANSTPNGLEILKGAHWKNNGGFKTFIIDPFNLEKPPLEVCRYLNRHGEHMVFTEAGREIMRTGQLPQS